MHRRLCALFALLASPTLACGNSSSSSAASSDGGADGGPLVYDSNLPSTGCGSSSAKPGTTTVQLTFGGLARSYILHVPPGYTSKPTPVVINMHGLLSDDSQQEAWSAMDSVADSENFIVAYPEGAGTPTAWNAGTCCAFSDTSRDDVSFISAIIDDIGENACVALDRVYATGMSNGGFMSHDLGCNLSDRIAAIGPVSGVMGVPPEDCTPGRAIPVMEFHGTADPLVPYDGGSPNALYWSALFSGAPPVFQSVASTISFWVTTDGCDATPRQTYSNGDATCETYDGCEGGAEVTLCTIAGGGHTWPGGSATALPSVATAIVGPMSTSINASSQLWTFFKVYKLPVGFDAGVTVPPPYAAFSAASSDAGADVAASDASME